MAKPTHLRPRPSGRIARAQAVTLAAAQRVTCERQALYREARAHAGSLLELSEQLQSATDPSELISLQETGRAAARTLVGLLLQTGYTAPSRRRTDLDLLHAVELLEDVLGLAQQGLTGSRHVALDLALIVRDRFDHAAGVEAQP
jgi:hypothetical protein